VELKNLTELKTLLVSSGKFYDIGTVTLAHSPEYFAAEKQECIHFMLMSHMLFSNT
jgi:hypothetical protein